MLDPDAIDLEMLCMALDDRDHERSWWIDPATGEVAPHTPDVDGEDTPEEDGWTWIEPETSGVAYRDMVEFAAEVPDRRLADRLERALGGRGAFRRFKDALYDHDDVRDTWHRFRDARAARRAIDWLEDNGLVTSEAAERARAARPDPTHVHDPLAAAVAADLRAQYGPRLRQVLVFGSRARGDHREDSDLDLLVVLADPVDRSAELRAMDDVLWKHTLASDVVITSLPVGEAEWARPRIPVLIEAAKDAVPA